MRMSTRVPFAVFSLAALAAIPAAVPASATLTPEALRLLNPATAFGQACGQGKKRSRLPQRIQYAMANTLPQVDTELEHGHRTRCGRVSGGELTLEGVARV